VTDSAYQMVPAVVMLDGRKVPVVVGIPAKVVAKLAEDARAGKPTWRASFTSGVAVRVDVERKATIESRNLDSRSRI